MELCYNTGYKRKRENMNFNNITTIAKEFNFSVNDLDSVEACPEMTVFCFRKPTKDTYMYVEVFSSQDDINTLEYSVLVDNMYVKNGVIINDIIQ